MAAEASLTVSITDEAIVIRLPLSVIPIALECASFNEAPETLRPLYRVTDVKVFAEAIVEQLNREEEDGTTVLHVLFDAAMDLAIDDGAEGVEEVKGGE